jgi:hypothetical protein
MVTAEQGHSPLARLSVALRLWLSRFHSRSNSRPHCRPHCRFEFWQVVYEAATKGPLGQSIRATAKTRVRAQVQSGIWNHPFWHCIL